MKRVLALDVGSTTTKARLFALEAGEWMVLGSADRPTTVEEPLEDVMMGVHAASAAVGEQLGIDRASRGGSGGAGGDLRVLACSSAGGGLRMVVCGVVRQMTAESAQRAALGAGAIVQDVLTVHDGRFPVERIARIRSLNPDMILLTGGTDGGQIGHVIALAEWVRAADPRPRHRDHRIPIIYAGNADARSFISEVFEDSASLHIVDNLRPTLESEVLGPAREAIHEVFMEHVMVQAPGYTSLLEVVDAPILPTPGAFGLLMQILSRQIQEDLVAVDVGGATTDCYSVIDGELYRTVSANLGMTYSASNVFASTQPLNIARWLPYTVSAEHIRQWTVNKMIRPTTLPHMTADLQMEHAIAREAIRLAFAHHNQLVVGLKGIGAGQGIGGVLSQGAPRQRVDLMRVREIIGSGGVLSHAGRPSQALSIMVDAFAPEGLTRLRVDSGFVAPHLGVLAQLDRSACLRLAERILVDVGWCLAPRILGRSPEVLARVEITGPSCAHDLTIFPGEYRVVRLEAEGTTRLVCRPTRGVDVGAGPGRTLREELPPCQAVLVLDGRGRPLPDCREEPLEELVADTRRRLALHGCYDEEMP